MTFTSHVSDCFSHKMNWISKKHEHNSDRVNQISKIIHKSQWWHMKQEISNFEFTYWRKTNLYSYWWILLLIPNGIDEKIGLDADKKKVPIREQTKILLLTKYLFLLNGFFFCKMEKTNLKIHPTNHFSTPTKKTQNNSRSICFAISPRSKVRVYVRKNFQNINCHFHFHSLTQRLTFVDCFSLPLYRIIGIR